MEGYYKMNCVVHKKWAMVIEQNANILKCINLFESGSENIYLVDNEGRYRWRAAQRGKSHFQKNAKGKWVMEFSSLPPIVTDLEVNFESQVAIKKLAHPLFSEHKGITEFPIVDFQGKIKGVVRSLSSFVDTEPSAVNWDLFEKLPDFLPKGKIYIASLQNAWLKNLRNALSDKVQIDVLNEENFDMVLSEQSDGVLLYAADVFPSCPKMSVRELYERLKSKYELKYKNTINVVVSVSPSLLKYVAVPLYIMTKNLPNKKINYFILHDGLPEKELARIYEDCAHYDNVEMMDILVSENDQRLAKKLNEYIGRDYWPASVFYGVVAWKYLPKYLDRVLYLDAADLMVMDDLDEYYFSNFDGMEIMSTIVEFKKINDKKYVMYDVDDLWDMRYRQPIIGERFNGGVAMLNLDKMRQTAWDMPVFLDIAKKLVDSSQGHDVYLATQSIWSVAYLGRTKAFGAKENELTEFDRAYTPYNVCGYYFRNDKPVLSKPMWYDPKVLHFAGAHKPWRIKWHINPIDEFTDSKIFYNDVKYLPERRQHIFQYIWHNYAYELIQKRREWKKISTQIEGLFNRYKENSRFREYVLEHAPNLIKHVLKKKIDGKEVLAVKEKEKSILGVIAYNIENAVAMEDMLEFANSFTRLKKYDGIFLTTDHQECFMLFKEKFGNSLLNAVKPDMATKFLTIQDNALIESQEVSDTYLANLIYLSCCDNIICSADILDYYIARQMLARHNSNSWIIPHDMVAPLSYKAARMNIFLIGENSSVEIINSDLGHPFVKRKATWINRNEGDCYVLEYGDGVINAHLKCHGGERIGIKLGGFQVYDERRKEHLPIWTTYTSCCINGSEMVEHYLNACMDENYWKYWPVKDGDELDVSIRWQIYDYDNAELNELLLRMMKLSN